MAVSTASVTRRLNIHSMVIFLSLTGAMLAILPIVAGVVSSITGHSGTRTAFATAPSGEYAVFARAGESVDEVLVASTDSPSVPLSVATIPHLPGFPANGVVSPDGRKVAFVVVDAGTSANPGASLVVLDLESGALVRVAIAVDHLQEPQWAPASDAVVVTRGGDAAPGPVVLFKVQADASGESQIFDRDRVLGIYPIGFDASGALFAVVIDDRGSTLVRDGVELQTFSSNISRDWELSPDGTSLAFVDTVLGGGARYESRVVGVEPGATTQAAQVVANGPESLGVTWHPVTGEPTFGSEPAIDPSRSAAGAQTLSGGFDIPLEYAASGDTLAVQHWTGDGFENPGGGSIDVVTGDTRFTLPGATGFFGWSAR